MVLPLASQMLKLHIYFYFSKRLILSLNQYVHFVCTLMRVQFIQKVGGWKYFFNRFTIYLPNNKLPNSSFILVYLISRSFLRGGKGHYCKGQLGIC